MKTSPHHWQATGVSARGLRHARQGTGNEDAWTCQASQDGFGLVCAVSDGLGAPAHCRAADGASLAIEAMVAMGVVHDRTCGASLAHALLANWRVRVHDHARARPLSGEEVVLCRGELYTAYAATLVAARIDAQGTCLLQVGDGDLVIGRADGSIGRPLHTVSSFGPSYTPSLGLADALHYCRLFREDHAQAVAPIDFVFLATDGVANSFPAETDFLRFVSHLRGLARKDWNLIETGLVRWIERFATHGSGDDSTICIAAR